MNEFQVTLLTVAVYEEKKLLCLLLKYCTKIKWKSFYLVVVGELTVATMSNLNPCCFEFS